MISLRFLGSDEISSKSIHLERRIMAVVPATAVAANVSTGRMKVVLLLVPRPPLPSFLFSFLRVSSVRTNKRDLHADLRAGSNRLISNRFGSRRVSFFLLLSLLSSLNHCTCSPHPLHSRTFIYRFFLFSFFLFNIPRVIALLRGMPFFISIPSLFPFPEITSETMRFKGSGSALAESLIIGGRNVSGAGRPSRLIRWRRQV